MLEVENLLSLRVPVCPPVIMGCVLMGVVGVGTEGVVGVKDLFG